MTNSDESLQPDPEDLLSDNLKKAAGIEWKVVSPTKRFLLIADTINETLTQKWSIMSGFYELLRKKTLPLREDEDTQELAQQTDDSADQLQNLIYAIQAVLRDNPGKPLPLMKFPGEGKAVIALDLIPNKRGEPIKQTFLDADIRQDVNYESDIDWQIVDNPEARARLISDTLMHTINSEFNAVANGADLLTYQFSRTPTEAEAAKIKGYMKSIHGGAIEGKAMITALDKALTLPLDKPLPIDSAYAHNKGTKIIALKEFAPKGFTNSA